MRNAAILSRGNSAPMQWRLTAGATAAVAAIGVALVDNFFFVGNPYAFDLPTPAEWLVFIISGLYLLMLWRRPDLVISQSDMDTEPIKSEMVDRLIGPVMLDVDSLLESADRIKIQVQAIADSRDLDLAA